MQFVFNDGGRAAAGFKGSPGDCVARAIAIATERPYCEVYDALYTAIKDYAATSRSRAAQRGKSPRDGVFKQVYRPYLAALGWTFVPTMGIGTGCKVHLRDGELPMGRLIVKASRHLVAVIDGVIHDTHDCSRDGTRCVYGYYRLQS